MAVTDSDGAPAEQVWIDACEHLSWDEPQRLLPDGGVTAREFPILRVRNQACDASIALQGAQLLSARIGGDDLLWLSPRARFLDGFPVRGGVPICLPWFGVNRRHPDYPKHGFARLCPWQLHSAESEAPDRTRLKFVLDQFSSTPHPCFAHCFQAEFSLLLGRRVELELRVVNRDQMPMPLSWALHSYHPVEDSESCRVQGLDQCRYLDNTRGLQAATESGDVSFDGELDRVYLQVPNQQRILTERSLVIEAEGSPTAIVWNPGADRAASMADIGVANYRHFICVERGAACDDELLLEPDKEHLSRVCFAWL